MGSGKWSPNTYQQRVQQRQARNQDVFSYSRDANDVHPSLNPFGLEMRESRDSSEHPASNSIIVGLDVSGSMGRVVRGIHKDLPNLLGLLLGQQYIPHPQIMFAAFSNGTCDRVPVQVGQFESDNRMDENLENMVLGGRLAGGCDIRESAELMIYLAARHTSIDCWEKRQRKGYMFLITDEMAYESIKAKEIDGIFGTKLGADIPLKQMVEEAGERYHIFVLIPMGAQGGSNAQVPQFFKSYLPGKNVILLENPDDVSETIALSIGLTEGNITLADAEAHLKETGLDSGRIKRLITTLSPLASDSVKGAGGLSELDDDDGGSRGGSRRL